MSMDGFSRHLADRWHLLPLISLIMILVCSNPLSAQDNHFTVDPVFIAGGRGSSPGDFGIPESVILDSRGQVAVTDKGRMMVHVYSRHTGESLFSIGGLGSDAGEFNRPNGIAVDSQGRVLVVEQRNRRIQIFDADYNPIGEFGFLGSADGGFQKPMGIAVDSQDNIYVTDESRGDVQVFDRDGSFLWKFADTGPRLRQVESIEVDERSQRIFVCDESRSTVNLYDLQGNYLSTFGEQGSGAGQFGNDPNAIRVDSKQRIWVNDQGNMRINVYASDTSFLASFYNSANGMESADGMELSELHNLLLVADQGNDRVLAFDLMALQAQLEVVELAATTEQLHSLTAHSGPEYAGMTHPLWEQTKLYLEAHGTGNASQIDVAIVRVASASDARGVLIRLTETGTDTGIFRGQVQLAESSDPTRAQLTAHPGNQVRAHLAGCAWEVDLLVNPLPAPEVHGMSAGPGTLLALHRQPRLTWDFHDPAGIRTQDAFEVMLFHEDSIPVWSSGEQPEAVESFDLTSDLLPAASARIIQLRVRSGALWSHPHRLVLRRNTPPPMVTQSSPADDTVLQKWPPRLRAFPSEDADGQPLKVRFETRTPNGKHWTSASMPVLEKDWLECTDDFNIMENETLHWRITTDDGIETTSGPWQRVHRNEVEEQPTMPTLLGPTANFKAHDDVLHFTWSRSTDPDPKQQPLVFFEWRKPHTNWHREPADSPTTHRWAGIPEDGRVRWRVIVQDPTGHQRLSLIRDLDLSRHWLAELRAIGHREASLPLTIGARPGAQDTFVAGEDMLTPSSPGQLQVRTKPPASKPGAQSNEGDRIVDFRRPRSPGLNKQEHVYDILVTGRAGETIELQITRLQIPSSWSLLWQDQNRETPIELTLEKPLHLRLDHLGKARGHIQISLAEEIVEPRHLENKKENRGFAEANQPMGFGRKGTKVFSLQHHLSLLANPLHPGIHLLPTGLATPVEIQVFDARGRRVQRWTSTGQSLQAADIFGRRDLPSGVYLLRMRTHTQSAHRKILWRP